MRDLKGLEVPLKDFKASAFSMELLAMFEKVGIDNPVMFGGALRDQYMGLKINDYDVWGHWEKLIDRSAPPERNADKIMAALHAAIPGLTGMGYTMNRRTDGPAPWTQYKFNFAYKGSDVSLYIDHIFLSLEDKFCGDAPINSIVMDSSGRTLTHLLFKAHAAQKIYQPYNNQGTPEEYERRFTKLRKKIPELRYSWNSWLQMSEFYRPILTDNINMGKQAK